MTSKLPVNSGSDAMVPQPPSPAAPQMGRQLEPPEEGANWRRYLAAIIRYRWLAVAVVIAGTTLGVVATRFLKPKYMAQGTIWIQPQSKTTSRTDQGPIRSDQLLQSSSWVDLLKSYTVMDEVVRELHLYVTPKNPTDTLALSTLGLKDKFRPGDYRLTVTGSAWTLATKEGVTVQRGQVGDSVGTQVGFAWVPPAKALTPGAKIQFTVVPPRDAAVALSQNLIALITDRDGNFMSLELDGTDPHLIAKIVNAVANRFVTVAAQLKRAKLVEYTKILDGQLRYAASNLRDAENGLESFRVKTVTLPTDQGTPVVPGLEQTRDPVFKRFFDMKIQRDELQHDREAIGRVLVQIPDSGLSVDGLSVIDAVQKSSELPKVLAELTNAQAELRGLKYRYTDENPQVQRVQQQVTQLATQTVPRMARELMSDIQAREQTLDQQIASASRDLRQIPQRSIEEARLTRNRDIAEDLYKTLQSRYEEARLADASSIPDVRVLDAAVAPRDPVSNRGPIVILGAFAASLGLALVGAILLDRVDRHLRYPEQVTDEMGLPILGAVPHVKANGKGVQGDDMLQVVEALRGVRLGLVHAHGAAGPLVATITSPGAHDGKSFIATNLALAFAEAGHRTLLIDADVRRGELHRLLGARRKPGLVDFLQGGLSRETIIQQTRYPALDFIGGGTRRQSAPELLSSPAMGQLLTALRGSYNVILCDSPPLGAGVDSLALGTATGNLLLVLRTGVTDRELAEAKLDVVDRLPIRILGAVLNDIRPNGAYRYYAYHYYVEGYEARDEEATALPAG